MSSGGKPEKVSVQEAMARRRKGEFVRSATAFHDYVTANGSSGFKAEANRYHLYVSLACPWAHRTLIVRKLKGLENAISTTVVDWYMARPQGWNFTDQKPKCTKDPVFNAKYLSEIYYNSVPDYRGGYTVPVLFDKKTKVIVNNESSEIIRMLNTEFNAFCKTEDQKKLNLYPEHLKSEIDEVNDWVYPYINNGVYRCGFASTQEAYNAAVKPLFEHLDKVEDILSMTRYLTGNQLTEADIRLFTTLVRFDTVYVGHFKCNIKRIIDYPNIWGFVRDIYQTDGIAATCDQEHIQKHYQQSHPSVNPSGIVAIGPDIDFKAPHDRKKFSK
ncbi:glutathionyl-hydroquinone reductase YqjG-like [Ptychodera flava]|uniref:glutathionyl-hydroquinone reductase YqjG-like n=1 Tax=Ptychodera flava TaxID=63121 RepID=UPI00396A4BCC